MRSGFECPFSFHLNLARGLFTLYTFTKIWLYIENVFEMEMFGSVKGLRYVVGKDRVFSLVFGELKKVCWTLNANDKLRFVYTAM